MLGKILGLIIDKIKNLFKISSKIEDKALESGKEPADYVIDNLESNE